jgi:hypothetical protein
MKASDAYLKWLLFFMLLSSIAKAQPPVFVIHAPDKYSTEERFEAWASPTMIDGATLASLFSGIRTGSARFILKKGPSLSGIAIGIQLQAGAPGMRIQLSDAGNGDVLETLNHIHLDKSKSFLTRFFVADSIMLEVLFNEPADASAISMLAIPKIYVQPAAMSGHSRDDRFGISLPCHVNAGCPEAEPWKDQQTGACRILMAHEEGLTYCSGTLMNNTREDRAPYILSAFHCSQGLQPIYDLWRFDFQYYEPRCDMPESPPQPLSFYGCSPVAGRQESDFLLLRLSDTIPLRHRLYYHGWSYAADTIPSEGVMLHHPRGDVLKFSRDTQALELVRTIINWGNGVITPPNHHLRANWDIGTMEKGSSGAALLNKEKRVVGQLNGGSANCETVFRSLFGRLAMSWAQGDTPDTRLKEWLDPEELNPVSWHGRFFDDTSRFTVRWKVMTPDSQAITGLYINLVLPGGKTAEEISPGTYRIEGLAPTDTIDWATEKKDNPFNGVDQKDVTLIIQHLLQVSPITDPYQIQAADINRNGLIDQQDAFLMTPRLRQREANRRLLEDWLFIPESIMIRGLEQDVDLGVILGIKPGDINFDRKVNPD